ncbi:MAG: alcohol dehydrogenase catalytic domain-containing protein [Anaerolineaceae bacterium]|nr:alcohol dehydrogenase catalytic domain-containing protein [Anaerolineaceae bacterium]
MRALVFDETLKLVEDVPLPLPAADEVLIHTRRAGICNTDLELVRGMYDFRGIPGHEFCGEVVQGPDSWRGRRVTGEINISCGDCRLCRLGIPSQCLARHTLGIHDYPGAFADYFRLPLRNLHVVPDGVSDDAAVFTEPLAAALQVTEAVHIQPGSPVLVIGAGKLGLLIVQVLKLVGADVSVLVRHEKQACMLQRRGISALRIEDIEPQTFPVVVEVSGAASGLEAALRLVRSRGTIVLKSTYQGTPQVDMTQVAVREIAIRGSRCGPFAPALKLLEQGLVDVSFLIEGRYPLGEGLRAMERAANPGTLKILFDFAQLDTDLAAAGT